MAQTKVKNPVLHPKGAISPTNEEIAAALSEDRIKAALAGDSAALKAILQEQEEKQRAKLEAFLVAYDALCAEHGCRISSACELVDVGGGRLDGRFNYFPIVAEG